MRSPRKRSGFPFAIAHGMCADVGCGWRCAPTADTSTVVTACILAERDQMPEPLLGWFFGIIYMSSGLKMLCWGP